MRPFGFGNEGEWEAYGLNDCFKACLYHEGGSFKPHYDGVFVKYEKKEEKITITINCFLILQYHKNK